MSHRLLRREDGRSIWLTVEPDVPEHQALKKLIVRNGGCVVKRSSLPDYHIVSGSLAGTQLGVELSSQGRIALDSSWLWDSEAQVSTEIKDTHEVRRPPSSPERYSASESSDADICAELPIELPTDAKTLRELHAGFPLPVDTAAQGIRREVTQSQLAKHEISRLFDKTVPEEDSSSSVGRSHPPFNGGAPRRPPQAWTLSTNTTDDSSVILLPLSQELAIDSTDTSTLHGPLDTANDVLQQGRSQPSSKMQTLIVTGSRIPLPAPSKHRASLKPKIQGKSQLPYTQAEIDALAQWVKVHPFSSFKNSDEYWKHWVENSEYGRRRTPCAWRRYWASHLRPYIKSNGAINGYKKKGLDFSMFLQEPKNLSSCQTREASGEMDDTETIHLDSEAEDLTENEYEGSMKPAKAPFIMGSDDE